ncbi:cell filamentation protein [Pontibacter ummariensis]|uniref:protein adenylyltransferase n=1 Tax=Pontibacter ummariensis TaxID=1610492 RepID=A0A239IX14_9BACT|nr:Fic family protein [Pontibacter ummariensis]PRY08954.1 cell filamentation protein [Pontibacter ummariensis]SNS96964.1 cell filamentation protein [Pontibacter ummariensis]
MNDVYCYPDTDVLINRFDIRDKEKLSFVELNHWRINVNVLSAKLPKQPVINLELWQRIHRETFGTVYPWAGEIRSVKISKGNAYHATPNVIVPYGNQLLGQLKDEHYLKGLDKESFLRRAAYFLEELNAIHPFREGNTRTLKILFSLLSRQAGYSVDWLKVSAQSYSKAEHDSFAAGRKEPPPFYTLLQGAVEQIKPTVTRQFKI